jgi:DUF1680 family protein
LARLGQYVYSLRETEIAVHLFVRSTTELHVAGQRVTLRQATDYPWDGQVRIDLERERSARFALRVRVPGWCRGATLRVNDVSVPPDGERGYVRLERTWRSGDQVTLDLPMPVQRVYAHPAVAEDAGRVALQRGPIVYCLEQADNAVPLDAVRLIRVAPISTTFDATCLGGVVKLASQGLLADAGDWSARLYRADQPPRLQPCALVAVPYAVWGNRSDGQMRTWIHEASSDV